MHKFVKFAGLELSPELEPDAQKLFSAVETAVEEFIHKWLIRNTREAVTHVDKKYGKSLDPDAPIPNDSDMSKFLKDNANAKLVLHNVLAHHLSVALTGACLHEAMRNKADHTDVIAFACLSLHEEMLQRCLKRAAEFFADEEAEAADGDHTLQ